MFFMFSIQVLKEIRDTLSERLECCIWIERRSTCSQPSVSYTLGIVTSMWLVRMKLVVLLNAHNSDWTLALFTFSGSWQNLYIFKQLYQCFCFGLARIHWRLIVFLLKLSHFIRLFFILSAITIVWEHSFLALTVHLPARPRSHGSAPAMVYSLQYCGNPMHCDQHSCSVNNNENNTAMRWAAVAAASTPARRVTALPTVTHEDNDDDLFDNHFGEHLSCISRKVDNSPGSNNTVQTLNLACSGVTASSTFCGLWLFIRRQCRCRSGQETC